MSPPKGSPMYVRVIDPETRREMIQARARNLVARHTEIVREELARCDRVRAMYRNATHFRGISRTAKAPSK